MKLIAIVLLLTAVAPAKDKRQLSDDEKQTAYNVAVNHIAARLKVPSTAVIAPFEQATFSAALRNRIDVRLEVDAQNAYGTMLRNRYVCRIGPQRKDGLYWISFCREE